MSMNFIFRLFILFSLSLSFSVVYADEIERQRIVDAVKQHGIDEKGYLAKDGKSRYFATYEFGKDGGVDLKFKKSYLPAVTDGVNHDKTSKFRIPPNAKKMAKLFAKGANHAMFLSMIIDVLGDGVDYVLDPKNNSVQYTTKSGDYSIRDSFGSFNADTAQAVCQLYLNKRNSLSPNFASRIEVSSDEKHCLVYGGGANYNGAVAATIHSKRKKETKVMNDEEFAQAVIELAKADNAKAKKVVLDVAKQAVSDGDYDKEIQKAVDELNADETKDDTQDNTSDSSNASSSDSTNTDSQDDTQATPNNNNGGNNNNNNKLPGFCDWAKPVCGLIEWFKTEPDYPDSELPEKDIPVKSPLEFDKDYVKANAQCPPDIVVPFNTGFSSHELVFNLTPICDFVRVYLSKVVLIMAYVFATLHISSAFKV